MFDYTRDSAWSLIKLHGSANWSWPVRIESLPDDRDLLVRAIAGVDVEARVGKTIVMHPISELYSFPNLAAKGAKLKEQRVWYRDSELLYPALAVPITGKYEFVCPPDQIEHLRYRLKGCPNFLVLGHSGRDNHFLDLLKDSLGEGTQGPLCVVAGNDAAKALELYQTGVPQFQNVVTTVHGSGFTQFVLSTHLEDFLERLV